jgi:hypothetical protein
MSKLFTVSCELLSSVPKVPSIFQFLFHILIIPEKIKENAGRLLRWIVLRRRHGHTGHGRLLVSRDGK